MAAKTIAIKLIRNTNLAISSVCFLDCILASIRPTMPINKANIAFLVVPKRRLSLKRGAITIKMLTMPNEKPISPKIVDLSTHL